MSSYSLLLATTLLLGITAGNNLDNCCSEKTVGNVQYTLVNIYGSGSYPANCLSGCIYQVSPPAVGKDEFCFATGDLAYNCDMAGGEGEEAIPVKYCSDENCNCYFFGNNFTGGDIAPPDIGLTSWHDCGNLCNNLPSCKAWVWADYGAPNSYSLNCWLKDTPLKYLHKVANPYMYAGNKYCPGNTLAERSLEIGSIPFLCAACFFKNKCVEASFLCLRHGIHSIICIEAIRETCSECEVPCGVTDGSDTSSLALLEPLDLDDSDCPWHGVLIVCPDGVFDCTVGYTSNTVDWEACGEFCQTRPGTVTWSRYIGNGDCWCWNQAVVKTRNPAWTSGLRDCPPSP